MVVFSWFGPARPATGAWWRKRTTRCVILFTLLAILYPGCRRSAPLQTGNAGQPEAQRDAQPAAPIPPHGAPNLLVITVDTLRRDHVGSYGYFRDTTPIIDALAGESLVFDRMESPIGHTLPAHVSLFTGAHPLEHGVLGNSGPGGRSAYVPAPGLVSLASALRANGHVTAGFVSSAILHAHTGIAAGFDEFHENAGFESRAEATTDRVLAMLDRWTATPTLPHPFMIWAHYYDPHHPYAPPAPFDRLYTDETDRADLDAMMRRLGILPGPDRSDDTVAPDAAGNAATPNAAATGPTGSASGGFTEAQLRRNIDVYDGEIRYVDTQIGRLFDGLRQAGAWDDLVVVLVSDHGEGLGQHGIFGHGDIYLEGLRIPAMIRVPGHPARRVSTRCSLIDLVPTLCGLVPALPARAIATQQGSGHDVLADGPSGGVLSIVPRSFRFRVVGLTDGPWRFEQVFKPTRPETRLFDLRQDPHELTNLAERFPDVVAKMRARSDALYRSMVQTGLANGAGKTRSLTPRQRRHLIDLGYLEPEQDDLTDRGETTQRDTERRSEQQADADAQQADADETDARQADRAEDNPPRPSSNPYGPQGAAPPATPQPKSTDKTPPSKHKPARDAPTGGDRP